MRSPVIAPTVTLALAAALAAQGPYTYPNRIVAAAGAPCAAVPGSTFASLDEVVCDLYGNLLWRGGLTHDPLAGIDGSNDRVLFAGRTGEDQAVLARTGFPEPSASLPAVTIADLPACYAVAPVGRVMAYAARLQGFGVVPVGGVAAGRNDSALYAGSVHGQMMVVRRGGAAPGVPGWYFDEAFDAFDQSRLFSSAYGQFGFRARLVDGNDQQPLDSLWTMGMFQLDLVAKTGDAWPVAAGTAVVESFQDYEQMDYQGQAPFVVTLSQTAGSPPATAADDTLLALHRPGQGKLTLVREGDPAPGTAGAVFDGFALPRLAMSRSGLVLFVGRLRGGDTTPANDTALYMQSLGGGGPLLVARTGDLLSDGSTIARLLADQSTISLIGEVAVAVERTGPGVTPFAAALLRGDAFNLHFVMRDDDPVPFQPGRFYRGIGADVGFADRGFLLATFGTHSGNGVVDGFESFALKTFSDRTVCTSLETLPLPGGTAAVTSTTSVARASGDGGLCGFGNDGEYGRLVQTTLGPAIVRGILGSMFAIPASVPATGGTQTMQFAPSASFAGYFYLVVGSLSGTRPAFPYGSVEVPLQNDFWTPLSQQNANTAVYQNTFGMLDAFGQGSAAFVFPSTAPFLQGATFHHAVLVFDPNTADLILATQPVSLHIY